MLPLLSRKTSWGILAGLFTFDNVVSYFGITKLQGHELNPVVAPFVEKNPLLYFALIPLTVILMFFVIALLMRIMLKVTKSHDHSKEKVLRVVLEAVVLYWLIANSSLNFIFLLGYSFNEIAWFYTSLAGIVFALIYTFFMFRMAPKKS